MENGKFPGGTEDEVLTVEERMALPEEYRGRCMYFKTTTSMKFGTVNPRHVEIRSRGERRIYDVMFTESQYELNFSVFGEELLLSIIGHDNLLWKRYWEYSWLETSLLGRGGHDKDFDDIIDRNSLSVIKMKCALRGVSYGACRKYVLRTILSIDDEKEWRG